ncbi:hypothetical protein BHU11_07050 [Tannerella sp. oral taxon 808]|nr:hypothetical protein BHU11_07050 [Tannerella sp. oral taxon 808]
MAMKRALLLLIGLVATALTAHAQRLLPRQTGVEITAGVPVIQNEKLIQPETFTANISFTRYLKAENYTFLSALYERQNLPYGKSNVPLSDALLLAGYMHPLRIGRRGKPLMPNDRIRFQHFGTCPTWANEKSNFSTLAQVGQRVKRRLSGRHLCLKTSFFIACFVHNPDMKSICPRRIDAFAFYPPRKHLTL